MGQKRNQGSVNCQYKDFFFRHEKTGNKNEINKREQTNVWKQRRKVMHGTENRSDKAKKIAARIVCRILREMGTTLDF